MKKKANDNLTSAQMLINNKQFTTSVHCSYYAVFQYMKYMLANTERSPINLIEQDSNSRSIDSHEHILREVKERLNTTPKNTRNFVDLVRVLKKKRIEADYTTKNINEDESLDCIEQANGAISKLKTYFGNI